MDAANSSQISRSWRKADRRRSRNAKSPSKQTNYYGSQINYGKDSTFKITGNKVDTGPSQQRNKAHLSPNENELAPDASQTETGEEESGLSEEGSEAIIRDTDRIRKPEPSGIHDSDTIDGAHNDSKSSTASAANDHQSTNLKASDAKSRVHHSPPQSNDNNLGTGKLAANVHGEKIKCHFYQVYNELKDNEKRLLNSSGKSPEDTLFNFYKDTIKEEMFTTLPTSWVLPLYDEKTMSIFDEEEREELNDSVDPLPELSKSLEQMIDVFDVKDEQASDDRAADVLNGKYDPGETDRPFRRWLTSNVGKWRDLCQQSLMKSGQPEQWWTAHLWSRIYDDILQTIPGMVLKRFVPLTMAN